MENSVDGSVIGVGKESLCCELMTKPYYRFVNLPISFFKDIKVRLGLPITLSVDDIGNPMISERRFVKTHCDFFDDFEF